MPPRFALGGNLTFNVSLPAYPASDDWVLHHRLVLTAGTGVVTFAAGAHFAEHAVNVPAATTAGWAAGHYAWASWVARGSDVHDVATGETTLLPNPRTASGSLDLRSENQIALDNVRATLRGTASENVLRYTIGGRQLEHYAMRDLLLLETKLARAVQREQQALTGRNPRRMVARVARA